MSVGVLDVCASKLANTAYAKQETTGDSLGLEDHKRTSKEPDKRALEQHEQDRQSLW